MLLADGKLAHELRTDFASTDPDRVQGNFLFTVGYDSKWVSRANSSRYTPQAPYVYDLWELTSRDKVRVFERDRLNPVVLGPEARFVLRVLDDNTFEVYEPFVLKKAVATVSTAARPVRFEFSPDGNRVAVSLSDTSVLVWDTAPWQKQLAEGLARTVPADLTSVWDDLAKDATTGLRAARILSAAGDKAVSLLGEKIMAKKAPDAARLKGLIAELSSSQFDAREKAEKELRALGAQAEPYLRDEVRTSTSPESRQRAGNLLKAVEARSLTAAENREVRAVQALQWIGTDSSRALLAKWVKGDPHVPLTRAAGQMPGR